VPATQIVITRDPVSLNPLGTTSPNGTQHGTVSMASTAGAVDGDAAGGATGALSATRYVGFAAGDPRPLAAASSKVFSDPVDPATASSAIGRTGTVYLDELGREMRTELALGADYAGRSSSQDSGSTTAWARRVRGGSVSVHARASPRRTAPRGTSTPMERRRASSRQWPQPFTMVTDGSTRSTHLLQHAFQGNAEVVSVQDAASVAHRVTAGGRDEVQLFNGDRADHRALDVAGGTRLEYATLATTAWATSPA